MIRGGGAGGQDKEGRPRCMWMGGIGMTRGHGQPVGACGREATINQRIRGVQQEAENLSYPPPILTSHKGTHKLVSADAMASITINFVGAQQTTVAADGVAMAKE